jgi:hypothetical protein
MGVPAPERRTATDRQPQPSAGAVGRRKRLLIPCLLPMAFRALSEAHPSAARASVRIAALTWVVGSGARLGLSRAMRRNGHSVDSPRERSAMTAVKASPAAKAGHGRQVARDAATRRG